MLVGLMADLTCTKKYVLFGRLDGRWLVAQKVIVRLKNSCFFSFLNIRKYVIYIFSLGFRIGFDKFFLRAKIQTRDAFGYNGKFSIPFKDFAF